MSDLTKTTTTSSETTPTTTSPTTTTVASPPPLRFAQEGWKEARIKENATLGRRDCGIAIYETL
eukprot:CAMPEP_0194042988 /NCGR_PEP_ID=MMETSP0009_2-20130614/14697_1 /TAXON_ID=210454 /ORGANISM="Grammatophora oceanica, Strain CCMP 410" /LENGTH=63 /DNA_ID=CAMNT_0038687051 /DNA_START=122 /DNA_END=309 /DNA_ORIENTATION=+